MSLSLILPPGGAGTTAFVLVEGEAEGATWEHNTCRAETCLGKVGRLTGTWLFNGEDPTSIWWPAGHTGLRGLF